MSELSLPLPAPAALPPAKLCSDAQLARRAARGDQRGFAEIFERHHQAVYRYCRSILGNSEDAADALQNTMAAVLRSLDGETRDIALKPWLFRIAHNEAHSILRRSRPQTELDDTQPCTRSGVEAGVLASEQLRQVVADVQALPDRQRRALTMRELNDLEYAEIAAVFGVAEGAARQAVHEARTMLHELSEGRAMACPDVRELISARDGRLLRGRRVRAHLRACESCTQFRAAIGQRRASLAMAAPPLAAPAAASILNGLLGGGHGAAAA
ncbi:MAG TPA: RNA polymerase sigma factor, partial [Solirubrobacteraceae bacterium]|nr:RNA polymerase sigma factor [Solirubrobacteraceae bacterium]